MVARFLKVSSTIVFFKNIFKKDGGDLKKTFLKGMFFV